MRKLLSREQLQEKFHARYAVTDSGCWEWVRGKSSSGYGQIWDGLKQRGSHTVSYELHIGKIPSGLFVCHQCDNKICVNPEHLFLGTCKENAEDMVRKGKQARPHLKLKDADVLAIWEMKRRFPSIRGLGTFLARWFSVRDTAINNVLKGRNRRDVCA